MGTQQKCPHDMGNELFLYGIRGLKQGGAML